MMDATTALIGAGACAALGAYHHAVYPAAMALSGRTALKAPQLPGELPSVEILMPAFNEAATVAAKIDALAAQDYPRNRMMIVLGCDGCTDNTASIARAAMARHEGLQVIVHDFAMNRGKTRVLNDLVLKAEAEIIVFSDVSALPAPDAIQRAVAHFTDPAIGAVGGSYALPDDAGRGESLYWRYQAAVKRGESRIAGLVGAHGAFYAVRRALLSVLPDDTINDDFIIPMQIAAAGWKTLYDPDIAVQEMESVTEKADFARRRRIGAGNLQQILRLAGPVLRSGHLGLILALVSGKGLRVAMGPLFLLGLVFLSVAAVQTGPALFALLLVLAASAKGPGRYAANGHLQSMIGAMRYLGGGYRRWHRVADQSA